ncbi:MAG TPA: hypothetical protein PK509_15550 [Catalimonadaceae bacterium]|nr:hypothetical protein [Catalimonadaceae bacterium]HPI11458.1 hypothetical protein [Catalimonadaceae bacterium]
MKKISALGIVLLLVAALISCKKEETVKTVVVPFPVDTLKADQYMVCTIDTIQYVAYTDSSGGPNEIRLKTNTEELTKIFTEAIVPRVGQQATRNMQLTLYDFKARKIGNYVGAQIFAESRTDLIVNSVDIEEQNWTIFNATTNRIQVTSVDSNFAKGNFNFKMQNYANPTRFLEVKNGKFKVRIR